ncbi:MAG: DUF6152 family protein [Roseateles asaccharophilus]|jgi:hypothetical protein|uniref:Uncharacterized protein n=1 Tax=Roseateles asaccharophilus TaxID=582607 RepID=A0A4R6N6Y0_9BURK|nr:DUF6152 family protein [Roseateles asaccharophilus]MDN3546121.1 DUF6152 family protein [Roseateles asaccharophilus]TDP11148.1 hypothetical protein DFR39_10371 [Roseateles asaccharophilus]
MERRLVLLGATLAALAPRAWAHHGWSSFDQQRPLWLEGRATQVWWRNPHAELDLQLPDKPALPADLKQRKLPAQSAGVDGQALLARAELPRRADKRWRVELAPLTRMQAWQVAEIKPGDSLGVLGFSFEAEKGEALLRAEYLFVGDKVYGLRSSPA